MKTLTKISATDHGRLLPFEEFDAAEWEDGYQYELIDGRVYVSPLPNLPQGRVERWIYRKLDRYSDKRPEVINSVYARRAYSFAGVGQRLVPNPMSPPTTIFPWTQTLARCAGKT